MSDLDRAIHEPARLKTIALLYGVKEADFLFLLQQSGLTKGNLSSHLMKLEESGYIAIEKTFRGKVPMTLAQLTPAGRKAFEQYRDAMKELLSETEHSLGFTKRRPVPDHA